MMKSLAAPCVRRSSGMMRAWKWPMRHFHKTSPVSRSRPGYRPQRIPLTTRRRICQRVSYRTPLINRVMSTCWTRSNHGSQGEWHLGHPAEFSGGLPAGYRAVSGMGHALPPAMGGPRSDLLDHGVALSYRYWDGVVCRSVYGYPGRQPVGTECAVFCYHCLRDAEFAPAVATVFRAAAKRDSSRADRAGHGSDLLGQSCYGSDGCREYAVSAGSVVQCVCLAMVVCVFTPIATRV